MGHYFVRVDDGKNVRRQILESSKLCVYLLKQEHRLAEIRRHKQAIIAHLRNELKELTFLLGSLEKELPVLTKKQLKELNPGAFKTPKKVAKKTGVKPVKAHAHTEQGQNPEDLSKLQRLERSLALIEGRLEKL